MLGLLYVMNQRVLAKNKTSATPPQVSQASSPLLHQRPLAEKVSESVRGNVWVHL
jgi:hypothetical protein